MPKEEEVDYPLLENLDADAYRNKRFIMKLDESKTVGKAEASIQPINIHILANHCSFTVETDTVGADPGKPPHSHVTLNGGEGDDVYCNGAKVTGGQSVALKAGDRVCMGTFSSSLLTLTL